MNIIFTLSPILFNYITYVKWFENKLLYNIVKQSKYS
jgi:hypothetical protein